MQCWKRYKMTVKDIPVLKGKRMKKEKEVEQVWIPAIKKSIWFSSRWSLLPLDSQLHPAWGSLPWVSLILSQKVVFTCSCLFSARLTAFLNLVLCFSPSRFWWYKLLKNFVSFLFVSWRFTSPICFQVLWNRPKVQFPPRTPTETDSTQGWGSKSPQAYLPMSSSLAFL